MSKNAAGENVSRDGANAHEGLAAAVAGVLVQVLVE
jgi:hypothetical protein